MKSKLLLSILMLASTTGVFGQQIGRSFLYYSKQKVTAYDSISVIAVLEKLLIDNPDSAVLVDTKMLTIEIPQETFMFEDSVIYKLILTKHPATKLNKQGQIILKNHLYLKVDSINIVPLKLQGFEFSKGITLVVKGKAIALWFESCRFVKIANFNLNNGVFLFNNTFDQGLYLQNQRGNVSIDNNSIYTPRLVKEVKHFPYKSYPYAIEIKSPELEYLNFTGNKIISNGVSEGFSKFSVAKIDHFSFGENVIDGFVDLSGILVERRVKFKDNVFNGKLCLYDFIFPNNFNKIYWKQFEGQKFFILKKEINTEFRGMLDFVYEPSTDSLIEENHKDLIVTYKTLHTLFNENGDTESANGCYAEKKDLEGIWLKHIYSTQGGFRAYLNYQLNRLLKFYTNHGTDPALAILISIYVLLGFSVFYFFFPSEWDIYSKSRLIENFKDFREKNDKGYVKPFLFMVGGFMRSFVNALTLSINSFVTLGFGNIPTRGLARYVCIVQGFIGWFLLSIFTVALINQVLS